MFLRSRTTAISLLWISLLVFPASPASGKDPKRPTSRPDQTPPSISFDVPNLLPPSHDGFRLKGDRYLAEFLPEGVIWKWTDSDLSYAFWVVEIRGSGGSMLWTRSEESNGFREYDGDIVYERTPLISEVYEGDRDGVTQIWQFSGNPLWSGGDVLILGELLTAIDAKTGEEGQIVFTNEGERAGRFFHIRAMDGAGRSLDIPPMLSGKTVTITIPGTWLSEVNSVAGTD